MANRIKQNNMKTKATDSPLGIVEHPNGRTYEIKFIPDNAPNAQWIVFDQQTKHNLGGFETYAKAVKAAQMRDKDLLDPFYRHPDKRDIKIQPASEEEIEQALAKIFPRSELTRQLDGLAVKAGIKVEGELKKVRQAVYSFAQISKKKFTVRPSGENGWLLIIRLS